MANPIMPVDRLLESVAAIEKRVAQVEALVLRTAETGRKRPKPDRRRVTQLSLFPVSRRSAA